MTDAAPALACLRAQRTSALAPEEAGALRAVAPRLGRTVIDLGGKIALGWSEGDEPQPDGSFEVHTLSRTPVLALACCLALCWQDRHEAPYPGRGTSKQAVLSLTRSLELDDKHIKGALSHDLPHAGLIEITGDSIRLGVAIATWPASQIEALRRLHDRLPKPTEQS